MKEEEFSRWSQRLQEGLISCIGSWHPHLDTAHTVRVMFHASMAPWVERAFPEASPTRPPFPPGFGPGFTLTLAGQRVVFSATETAVPSDLIYLDASRFEHMFFLSELPDARHEIYVGLRQDQVGSKEAREMTELLETGSVSAAPLVPVGAGE